MKSVYLTRMIAVVSLGVGLGLFSPESAQAQESWRELAGWFNSAPSSTSDHYDGLQDKPIPSDAKYCWVAEISDNWIGIAYHPNGRFFGIIYWTYFGYDIRTSLKHSVQKSNSSNFTEVAVSLWNENQSGLVRFKRMSTGSYKEVQFDYGPCPTSRMKL